MRCKAGLVSAALLATALAVALLPRLWSPDRADAQPAAKPAAVRWEYCELAGDHTGKCVLTTASKLTAADSWADLAKQLKAASKDDNPSDQSIRLAIFDHLGSQGWELATHTTFTMNGAFVSAKTFKRRR